MGCLRVEGKDRWLYEDRAALGYILKEGKDFIGYWVSRLYAKSLYVQ